MQMRWPRGKKILPRPGVEPESSRPQRDVLTTRPSKHLPTSLFFFFHKVLSLEVTPWRVHRDSLLCNLDRASPKGEGLRYGAINNRGDRVYRNTWCNVGTQRTSSRTKDTCWDPCRIWRWETSERDLFIWTGRPSVPVLFWWRHGWGIPPIPLWRHSTSRHVCWFELYLSDAGPGGDSHQDLSWPEADLTWSEKEEWSERRLEGELISYSAWKS